MAENKEKVVVEYSAKDLGVNKELLKIGEAFDAARAKSVALSDKLKGMGDAGKTLAMGAGALAAALGAVGMAAIKASGQFEQWNIAFTTMLGSQSKATRLMNEIKSFAAKTPFELPGLVESSKQLLAFGFAQEEIIPQLKVLGDIAAGVGVPVGQLANVFGQVKLAGRLMGQDLMQFTNAGVPLIAALAKNLGVTEGEIKKMVEAGKIGFPEVQKALTGMTTEGGKFFNLMDSQSKSFNGIMSNIGDNIGQFMTGVGDALLPIAKAIATAIQFITGAFVAMPDGLKQAIAFVGAFVFVFALLLTAVGTWIAITPAIAAANLLIGTTFAAALWPITAIVVALAALTGAAMLLINILKPLAEKTDALSEKHEALKDKARGLKDQMADLEEQGKKNTSQYVKLQDELKRTNQEIEKNAAAIQKNLEKLELEKKAIEEKIAAQRKVVAQAPQNTGELEKLESLERQKQEIVNASETAITALRVDKETQRKQALTELSAKDKEEKKIRDQLEKDLQKQADDIEMEEFKAKIKAKSDEELMQMNLSETAKNNLLKVREKEKTDARKKMTEEWSGFVEKAYAEEKDFAKAAAMGTLEMAKKGLIAQAKAFGQEMMLRGFAMLSNPITIVPGLMQIAAGGTIMTAAPAAINAIQLAEGGSMVVDRPTMIGQNVMAGEAGPERIDVTPLDKQEPQTIINNIVLDGETIATHVLKIGQQQRLDGGLDDLSSL
ncbi:tape measure protein [Polynucleobacter sp.]|uniref:tape measure protein n=1 Tax=Polynucleobacter sp. TaxID=2029855 RepID=UPI003F69FFDF